ncbi:MAG TPA: AbrB/MazE/SpoVT family DNA-binding domain-containing protein [Terracidiphilus sp.]|jgi:AbrB family looped-hinge helix DNA binding protein|nr:AbrB/MazE/SpoVT family DNA-binding domain-containing protein [Terracidiphilus sp.]
MGAEVEPMASAAVTSKGQVTLPVEIRRELGLKAGDRVRFVKKRNGEIALKPENRSIMEFHGMFKWKGKPVTIDEMNETIAKGWAGMLKLDE